jgi:cell division septation protein DedD
MKDDDYERPEKDTIEEVPVFSDRDLEEFLAIDEESTEGEETPREGDPAPETFASLTKQRRSKRSLMWVALLCLGLGILVLVVFFVMKPEVRKPQIVAKRMKRPIPSVEREEKPTIPTTVGEEAKERELSEGGVPKVEKPAPAKLPETLPVGREGGAEKKVVGTGGTELPEKEKGAEAVGEKPEIEGKEEVKPQVAKAEQLETRAIPERKMPVGRFTVNVGSFRKRARAERLMKQLEEKGYEAFVAEATIPKKGTWYRVSVGRFPSRGEARSFAHAFKEKEGIDSFVREVEETKR